MEPDYLGDPLFQLNLMLILSWNTSARSGFSSVFADAGSQLSFVEQGIGVPVEVLSRLSVAGVSVGSSVGHDVFLEHPGSRTFVPVECKRSSFGASSSTARQARGMLAMDGAFLGAYIGKPPGELWGSVLLYMTREGHGGRLGGTLDELCDQLRESGVSISPHACLELQLGGDGVALARVPGGAALPNLPFATPQVVMRLAPGQEPSTLYLIPFMPTHDAHSDGIAEAAFRERLRSATVVLFKDLGKARRYDIDGDFLERTIQVWSIWRNDTTKRNLRRSARTFLRRVFAQLGTRAGVQCTVDDRTISIPEMTREQVAEVRRYLRSAEFRHLAVPSPSAPVQGAFDEILSK